MNNKEKLLQALNSLNPDELFETLNVIGKEDIEKLIGMTMLAKVVIKKITGLQNNNERHDGWLARRRI